MHSLARASHQRGMSSWGAQAHEELFRPFRVLDRYQCHKVPSPTRQLFLPFRPFCSITSWSAHFYGVALSI